MTTNYEDILKKLDYELNILEIEEEDILVRAEKGIKLAKQTLKKVRSIIVDYEFKTKLDEISFFKCTKPKIYSKLIYYVKLFNIDAYCSFKNFIFVRIELQ